MSITVPGHRTSEDLVGLNPGEEYQFAIRAWSADGPGEPAYFDLVIPYAGAGAPDPWLVDEGGGAFGGLPHRCSFGNPPPAPGPYWAFGQGSRWPIESADGIFDQMSLKTQDSSLVGDGDYFGYDSEEKRVITMEISAGLAELAARCANPNLPIWQDPIIEPRCAMLRRHDDLPLRLDDWILMARPRRFLAPQRANEPTRITVGWEISDPALYLFETGPNATPDGWQMGSIRMGEATWHRPYPPHPPEAGFHQRGPAGADRIEAHPITGQPISIRTWRYAGEYGGGTLWVDNLGCRETYLRLRIDGPVEHPIVVRWQAGEYERLEINQDLELGEWLDIDMRLGTILLNGRASRYTQIARASSWFSCGPGVTFVNFLSRGGEITSALLTAWWRSAW